jgi:regulator of protease activity HflC (stomatin/prohibitin superfamily)
VIPSPAGPWEQAIRLAFGFLFAAIGVLMLAWGVSNMRVVPPDARAAVLRLGVVTRIEGPGLLLAWPQPIEQVVLLPGSDRQISQTVRRFDTTPVALTGQPPEFQVSPDARSNAAFLLTGETGIVHLQATLFYQIDDAAAYLLAASHVPAALDRIFGASAVAVCATRGLDPCRRPRQRGRGRCQPRIVPLRSGARDQSSPRRAVGAGGQSWCAD